jgi:peptidoglycan/LPS O-acetylase OafA/YrhL
MIIYRIYKKIENSEAILKMPKKTLKILLILILTVSIVFDRIPVYFYLKYCLYFILVFISLPFIFILTKKWKWDRYIGELSYPIYISHMLVLGTINAIKLPVIGGIGFEVAICTIAFAILLNEFVAKKIERIRQKRITPL